MDTKLPNQEELHKPETIPEDGGSKDCDKLDTADYLEMVRKLKIDLADKSNECEQLKISVIESQHDVESLSRELNECKLALFEQREDSRKDLEETIKSKKLEKDYVQLMNDFLALGERSDQYKLNLVDNYLAKSNAINSLECLMSSGAIANELEECQMDLDNRLAELNLAQAKVRNLEEENIVKEKTMGELKKAFEDAKIAHYHEISVLDEYINSLKNTITSYEKTLASYIEPTAELSEIPAQE